MKSAIMPLPDIEEIKDIETAKKAIKEMKDTIELIMQLLEGDMKEIEERLTAGAL